MKYSLVLNRRRASCIRHNLYFPRSSCIAIMFLSKKFGMSCISPWFSTFPACFRAWWCHCYIYGGMPCLLIHPGLWVICSAVLVLHQGFQKKYTMSSNTTRLLLSTREYAFQFPLIWFRTCLCWAFFNISKKTQGFFRPKQTSSK